jgi:hypothetical protein
MHCGTFFKGMQSTRCSLVSDTGKRAICTKRQNSVGQHKIGSYSIFVI